MTGQSTGGLGVKDGKSKDRRYQFSFVSGTDTAFKLKATAIGAQAGNGDLTIAETGQQIWIRGDR